MYDHWFRFDLSYSDKDLQDLFHDLFSIYSMNLVSPNILSVERGFQICGDAALRPKIYLFSNNQRKNPLKKKKLIFRLYGMEKKKVKKKNKNFIS